MLSRKVLLCLVVLLGITTARAQDDDDDVDESDVLDLTTDSFDKALSSNNFLLVEFYAPW